VAFREAETAAGWLTLPTSAGWEDAQRAGIDLGLVMLYRGGLRLALEPGFHRWAAVLVPEKWC
jgi:hypothetical protein